MYIDINIDNDGSLSWYEPSIRQNQDDCQNASEDIKNLQSVHLSNDSIINNKETKK